MQIRLLRSNEQTILCVHKYLHMLTRPHVTNGSARYGMEGDGRTKKTESAYDPSPIPRTASSIAGQ